MSTNGPPRVRTINVPRPETRQSNVLNDPARFKLLRAGRRFGKALALDTVLPSPDGWTTIGQVQVGDRLFDEEGNICTVTFVTPVQYNRPCYVVTFSDGTEVVADADHQWLTTTSKDRHAAVQHGFDLSLVEEVRTTRQVAETALFRGQWSNHAIEISKPLKYETKELPIDPYVLGAWLGDGDSHGSRLISADPEVAVEFELAGYAISGIRDQPSNKSKVYSFGLPLKWDGVVATPLHTKLYANGLLKNKHIPSAYMEGDEDQRLALIQGLMDTDGCAMREGCFFDNTNFDLATDFMFLVQSMGWKAKFYTYQHKDDGLDRQPIHRVRFLPNLPVFRLVRKLQRQKLPTRQSEAHFIKAVEPITSVPVKCIQVDSPNSLFLATSACIPTHNTTTALIAELVGHGPIMQETGRPLYPGAIYGKKIWHVAPTYTSLLDIWRDLKAATRGAMVEKNEVEHRIELPGGGSVSIRSTDEYENLRGPGLDGIILDEAAYIPRAAWTRVLRPMLADRQGWALFLFTPNGKNWMYELEDGVPLRKNWSAFHGKSTDNPRVTPEEIEEIRSDPEMSEMEFRQEYLAEYISPAAASIKDEWFHHYQYDPVERVYTLNHPNGPRQYFDWEITKIALVDLAVSTKRTSDWFVCQVWGVTPQRESFLIDQFRDRLEGPDQLPTLERIYNEHQPSYFGIESVAYQLSLVQAARRAGLPTKEIKADRDKVRRAQPLISRMSSAKVYFDTDAPYFKTLRKEFTEFPNGKFDDQVDAAAYASLELTKIQRSLLFTTKELEDLDHKVFILPDFTDLNPLATWNMAPGTTSLPGFGRSTDNVDLQTLLSGIAPSFMGDPGTIWHSHLSISRTNEFATITLGRISHWEMRQQELEGKTLQVQVPVFEVPLVFKAVHPDDSPTNNINQGLLVDFIIALRQIRGFQIASASFTNVHSAAAVQKLVRAEIAIIGAQIDPQTGQPLWQQPTTRGQTRTQTEEHFEDLKGAIAEQRVRIANNKFLRYELQRVEEGGNSLLHDDSAATSLAGTVGFLAKYGHLLIQAPDSDFVSLEEMGGSVYDLSKFEDY